MKQVKTKTTLKVSTSCAVQLVGSQALFSLFPVHLLFIFTRALLQ